MAADGNPQIPRAIHKNQKSKSNMASLQSAIDLSLSDDEVETRKRVGGRDESEGSRKRRREATSSSFFPPSLPPLFRLVSVGSAHPGFGLSSSMDVGCVSLRDLLAGQWRSALLSNCGWDFNFLLAECPRLRDSAASKILIHGHGGHGDGMLMSPAMAQAWNIKEWIPAKTQEWTCMHTKMIILIFEDKPSIGQKAGVRVVVATANFCPTDWSGKTQACWYQDFPLKDDMGEGGKSSSSSSSNSNREDRPGMGKGKGKEAASSSSCSSSSSSSSLPRNDFSAVLIDYLTRLKGPAIPFAALLGCADFSRATAVLVPSVPGKHLKGRRDIHRFGHMRVRHILSSAPPLPALQRESFVLLQVSSVAGNSPNWLMQLWTSFMAQRGGSNAAPSKDLMKKTLQLVWPTVEQVRTSIQGWGSGGAICATTANINKLRQYLHRWVGEARWQRNQVMPHIKTFCRYFSSTPSPGPGQGQGRGQGQGEERETTLGFLMMGSHNLSKSALGELQKNETQLKVDHYEMSVLFVPSRLCGPASPPFSCTPSAPLPALSYTCQPSPKTGGLPLDLVPLPYTLPPPRYKQQGLQQGAQMAADDEPWAWDVRQDEPDAFECRFDPFLRGQAPLNLG